MFRSDNTINVIESVPPKKLEALFYLDHDGSKPHRYASVSNINEPFEKNGDIRLT